MNSHLAFTQKKILFHLSLCLYLGIAKFNYIQLCQNYRLHVFISTIRYTF